MQDIHQKARTLIVKHESYRQYPYTDTTGHMTIGFGHNLERNGISMPVALAQLDEDVEYWIAQLSHKLPIFDKLVPARQAVLIDMAFNIGLNGLLEFKKLLEALENEDYQKASASMINSLWAQQVGTRAIEDSYIMRVGELSV